MQDLPELQVMKVRGEPVGVQELDEEEIEDIVEEAIGSDTPDMTAVDREGVNPLELMERVNRAGEMEGEAEITRRGRHTWEIDHGENTYLIVPLDGVCSCPDARYRSIPYCKHMVYLTSHDEQAQDQLRSYFNRDQAKETDQANNTTYYYFDR